MGPKQYQMVGFGYNIGHTYKSCYVFRNSKRFYLVYTFLQMFLMQVVVRNIWQNFPRSQRTENKTDLEGSVIVFKGSFFVQYFIYIVE